MGGWILTAAGHSSRSPRAARHGVVPILLAALACGARPAAADLPAVANPDSALAATLATLAGASLSLPDAIRIGLAGSDEVGAAQAATRAAAAVVKRERGGFDPELFASGTWNSQEEPSASPFTGSGAIETDQRLYEVGATTRLVTGANVTARVTSERLSTNSLFASFEPQYTTRGRLELVQPLLAGFGPAARRDLSQAERDLVAAQASEMATRLATEARIERLYWDLYAAQRDWAVARLLLETATALLEEARTRAGAGLVGPNQIANARVFLAEREASLLDRQEDMDGASDALAAALGTRPPAGVPRYRPDAQPPRDFDLAPPDTVVAAALRRNPELLAAAARIDGLRALERGARWDALPTLDAVGSVGGNGLTGRGRTLEFGGETFVVPSRGGFGDSWSEVFKREFPTWSAGLRFAMPIGARADRGERDRLRAEIAAAEFQWMGARRALEVETRRRHRELENARRRVQVAAEGADASLEQARIGRLEYQNGRTTAFELVRLGADVASAQQRYSQALVRAAQAAADLRQLTAGAAPAAR
jgi:outer membrane protein TolC